MEDDKRSRRPHPERQGPIRDWTGLYQAPPPNWGPIGGAPAGPNGNGPSADGSGPANAVNAGVDLGYRVIDSYLRQGQEWAAAIGAAPYANSGLERAQPLTERAFRDAAELFTFWMQQWTAMLPAAAAMFPAQMPQVPQMPTMQPSPTASSHPVPVEVQVASPLPARVRVELRERRESLACQPLQRSEPGAAAIDDAHFETAPNGVVFHVRVDPNQPAGTYLGVVFEPGSGEPIGTASVHLVDEAG